MSDELVFESIYISGIKVDPHKNNLDLLDLTFKVTTAINREDTDQISEMARIAGKAMRIDVQQMQMRLEDAIDEFENGVPPGMTATIEANGKTATVNGEKVDTETGEVKPKPKRRRRKKAGDDFKSKETAESGAANG